MAQAPLKKSSTPKPTKHSNKSSSNANSSSSNPNSKITKKGTRAIAPKNAKLAKQRKLTHKFSAGLIRETERMLGARAGHLEMLGAGGKKKKGPDGGKRGAMESVKGKGRAKGGR